MDFVFSDFGSAFKTVNGYELAQSLSPAVERDTLKMIWKATNHHQAKDYLRRNLKRETHIPNKELDAWTEVFYHYWLAVGAILAVQGDIIAAGTVSHPLYFLRTLISDRVLAFMDQSIRGLEGPFDQLDQGIPQCWIWRLDDTMSLRCREVPSSICNQGRQRPQLEAY